jgi:hypothetical protein
VENLVHFRNFERPPQSLRYGLGTWDLESGKTFIEGAILKAGDSRTAIQNKVTKDSPDFAQWLLGISEAFILS